MCKCTAAESLRNADNVSCSVNTGNERGRYSVRLKDVMAKAYRYAPKTQEYFSMRHRPGKNPGAASIVRLFTHRISSEAG